MRIYTILAIKFAKSIFLNAIIIMLYAFVFLFVLAVLMFPSHATLIFKQSYNNQKALICNYRVVYINSCKCCCKLCYTMMLQMMAHKYTSKCYKFYLLSTKILNFIHIIITHINSTLTFMTIY